MNVPSKVGALLLAAAGWWAVSEYCFLAAVPQQTTPLALRQMDNDDEAAGALRLADRGKNWLGSPWVGLLAVGALGGWLFRDDLLRLVGGRSSPQTRGDAEARRAAEEPFTDTQDRPWQKGDRR